MQVTCAAAPLQIEGTINGKSAYFRSRHGHWRLLIARSPTRPLSRDHLPWTWEGSRGVLHERTARAIIARCVAGWTGWDGQGEG
jgi:hypothetical protein